MSNNKQQTAVEWLAEKTFNQIELLKHLCINEEQFLNNMLIFREQAKEMEKEQKANTWNNAINAVEKDKWESFEQYYNQTYGGGEQ
jgi:hypothetical protein